MRVEAVLFPAVRVLDRQCATKGNPVCFEFLAFGDASGEQGSVIRSSDGVAGNISRGCFPENDLHSLSPKTDWGLSDSLVCVSVNVPPPL